MRAAIDTDVFCKLAAWELLDELLDSLGIARGDCVRLQALPHMLRKGRLVRRYGTELSERIAATASTFPVAPLPNSYWLNILAELVPPVGDGEASLAALAAEQSSCLLLTGDKRAVESMSNSAQLRAALAGRVVTLEGALLHLIGSLGETKIRQHIDCLPVLDVAVHTCFCSIDPPEGLRSYLTSLAGAVGPGFLWS